MPQSDLNIQIAGATAVWNLSSVSLFLPFCQEIATKCRRKGGSDSSSFKYLNPEAPMRFVCKSSGSRANNVQPASRKPARKVISPSDTFRKKARPRRLFCDDDRYVRNARNMCPLEVSLFLLHHRTFYDTAAAAAAVTISIGTLLSITLCICHSFSRPPRKPFSSVMNSGIPYRAKSLKQ